MAASAVLAPQILTDAGYLFIAPLGSTVPTNTVVGSVFTDTWPVAWLPLGATEDGTQFSYTTAVAPITVAEFYDPIAYKTTDRSGNIAFNLASFTLSNYRRAINGGVAAVVPISGTGTTALNVISPPVVGTEVRAMIGWESLLNDVRLICYQTINGGTVQSAFKKAPAVASIPVQYNLEIPTSTSIPWQMFSAGTLRG